MSEKSKVKRNFGGAWEGSAYITEFEQWARLALSAYENLNEMMLYTARPVFYVRGYTQEPDTPHLEFEQVDPPVDYVDTLKTTQKNARYSLIRLLDEIGMKADATALRMLDAAIRERGE